MNLSRRGFLLGATGVGALAILPVPLLLAAEVTIPIVNLQGVTTGRRTSNLSKYSIQGGFG